jgi:hypothetical protein
VRSYAIRCRPPLQIEAGKIAAIYVTRNPDKLRHLGGGVVH